MLKACGALLVALVAVGNSTLCADDSACKEESAEAAERQLEEARSAVGQLRRFEVHCLVSNVDDTFANDERWRFHVYAEEPAGYLAEFRPIEIKHMTARRTASGRPCELSAKKPETWLCVNATCTVLNEAERTYDTMDVGPKRWLAPLRMAHHQVIPRWLDPTVDWENLKSRYRIKRAKSTETEFFVELVLQPLRKTAKERQILDLRLDASHELIIDRRTRLPKRWRMITPTADRIMIYERFDINPAKRDLKVQLTGYQDIQKVIRATRRTAADEKDNNEPFRTLGFLAFTFRVLTWCPF
jgi:hypothetical protein